MSDSPRSPERPGFHEAVEGLILLREVLEEHRLKRRKFAAWTGKPLQSLRFDQGHELPGLIDQYCDSSIDDLLGPGPRAWLRQLRADIDELRSLPPIFIDLSEFENWIEDLVSEAAQWRRDLAPLWRLIDDCGDAALAEAIAVLRDVSFRFDTETPEGEELPELSDGHREVAQIIWDNGPINAPAIAKLLGLFGVFRGFG